AFVPFLTAGEYFQLRTAAITASSTMFPPDSLTTTSVTSPFSVTTKVTEAETESPERSGGAPFGYSGDLPEVFFAIVSTSEGRFRNTRVRSSAAGGAGVTLDGLSCASMRPRLPTSTRTVVT